MNRLSKVIHGWLTLSPSHQIIIHDLLSISTQLFVQEGIEIVIYNESETEKRLNLQIHSNQLHVLLFFVFFCIKVVNLIQRSSQL